MSSSLTCHNCGSSEFESDSARGDTVCTRCGVVIEDNVIVNEIQFEEGNFGATHIVGQRVTEEYGMRSLSVAGMMGSGRQSRQITLENAKRRIKTVGNQLNLNTYCVDQAFSFYKMALNRRLTHGRKNSHVIAACVYMTCRLELTPHILLDLSDVMQVNVYELGKTYLKLSSALCINIPPIDPCIYILRYAYKLGIKEKSKEVQMTALRLVSRMKRDWMHTGRRPSGLCGAALLVSARLHGLHCSIKDVIKVVKVCETTIRKRLNEFGDTPSSKLTLDEFLTVDLEGEEDPPCYKIARKKFKENSEEIEKDEVELKEELNEEIEQLQKKIDEAIEKSRKKLKGPYAKYAKIDENPILNEEIIINDENEITRQVIENSTIATIQSVLTEKEQLENNLIESNSNKLYFEKIKNLRPTAESLGLVEENNSLNFVKVGSSLVGEKQEQVIEILVENEVLNHNCKESENNLDNSSGELFFDDLDDDELNSYLLNQKEIETKTNYWLKFHADYLKEMNEKEKRKREEDEIRREREAKGEISPKKKRKSRKKVQIEASSAGEAIEKMLHEKKISNKINYDVLKKLNDLPIGSIDEKVDKKETLDLNESNSSNRLKSKLNNSNLKRLPSIRNQLDTSLDEVQTSVFYNKFKSNQAKNMNLIIESNKKIDLDESKTKKKINSVVVEEEVEEEEDEEYEEEDVTNCYDVDKERNKLSIANLMSDSFETSNYEIEDSYEYDYYDID